jgi:hypothetical protein
MLSDAALAYFDVLIGEYKSIKDRPCDDPQAEKLADELSRDYKTGKSPLTWGDLCAFDRLLLRLRTPDEIRERIPALESRYIEVARPSVYVDYLIKFPVAQSEPSEAKIRARIDGLISEFYRFVMMASSRERLRDRASRRLTLSILAFLLAFLIAGVVNAFINPQLKPSSEPVKTMTADTMSRIGSQTLSAVLLTHQEDAAKTSSQPTSSQPTSSQPTSPQPTSSQPSFWSHLSGTFMAVIFFGSLGGFISAQRRVKRRRVQSTPKPASLLDLISMEQEGPLHSTAPVNGAVFALVLYAMFTGGLITGAVFPQISTPVPESPYLRFWTYFVFSGPSSGLDWAKLVIWSFVAGFAERFVPDALSRLSTTSPQTTNEHASQ